MTVFDGIKVYVIKVFGKVILIGDGVLPETGLPDTRFALGSLPRLHVDRMPIVPAPPESELSLDMVPALRIIGITIGQGYHHVQVIG